LTTFDAVGIVTAVVSVIEMKQLQHSRNVSHTVLNNTKMAMAGTTEFGGKLTSFISQS
jgi:hypothetical protein